MEKINTLSVSLPYLSHLHTFKLYIGSANIDYEELDENKNYIKILDKFCHNLSTMKSLHTFHYEANIYPAIRLRYFAEHISKM